jgi:hypothetical protein
MILFLQVSCSGFSEAGKVLRNEKTNTTDEFLVKKKKPLILPPDFETLPKPGSINDNTNNDKDKIKKILKAPNQVNKNTSQSSSTEKSILEKIRK